ARARATSPSRSAAPAAAIAPFSSPSGWPHGWPPTTAWSASVTATPPASRSRSHDEHKNPRGRSMMIGMVLVTHGRLATEFIAALEHVVGPQQRVAAVCIGPEDDMEVRRRDILDSIKKVDDGDGVVLLTDMFGGTPSNLAISVLDRANVEVIAGINLPMLIKL